MCGIAGIYFWDRERIVPPEMVHGMCEAIVHRGPDDVGLHVDGRLGMGMRRLSIIDLNGGQQPIFNEDRSVSVVFNGEIYNHVELRRELEGHGHQFKTRSDTEVLVHGFEQWSTDLPGRLNGMFAFSAWDARKQRLMLARDHVGIKPLYVYQDDEKLVWASEIKALLTVPGIEASLDEKALFDFLTFGYVPAPRTMFRHVSKMEPASQLVIDDNRLTQHSYWNLNYEIENRGMDAWCEELQHLLDDSVRMRLMSDVPLGAFLSGGIDSSSIVATMSRLGVKDISTYAIGFDGKDAFHSELEKAAVVAKLYETDHHEIVVNPDVADLMYPLVRHLDEPMTDTSFLVTYLVSKLARETVTVILSGLGGDEIFAGYRRYLGPKMQRMYGRIPGPVHRGLMRPLMNRLPVDRGSSVKTAIRYLRRFVDFADQPEAARYQGYVGIFHNGQSEAILAPQLEQIRREYQCNAVERYYDNAPADDPLNRMMYADFKTAMVDSLLTFTDKMSMSVSLEARVPLLDRRLVELAAKMPPGIKLRGWRGMKHVFKRAMSDRLPHSILHQKKQGFGTPISRWFRGSLQPMLQDLLSAERIRERGYFRPQAVQQMIDDHFQQRADHSEHILALLTFEIWHQLYLDASTGTADSGGTVPIRAANSGLPLSN